MIVRVILPFETRTSDQREEFRKMFKRYPAQIGEVELEVEEDGK